MPELNDKCRKSDDDEIIDFVRKCGDKVEIGSMECDIYQIEHNKCCINCPSELGCGKYVRMRFVLLKMMMYKPRSFEDFQKMDQRINELFDLILNAKTMKELNTVPDV